MTNDDSTGNVQFDAMLQRARAEVLAVATPPRRRRRFTALVTASVLVLGGATATGIAVAVSSGPEIYVGPTTVDVSAPENSASELVVTFTCVDTGDYRVTVEGAPNGTMEGTCVAGRGGSNRFGFMLGGLGDVTDSPHRIVVTVRAGARFALESWYRTPEPSASDQPSPATPSMPTSRSDSFPTPDASTDDQLAALAAANDAQLISAMQERYAGFVVPQVRRERFVLEPEWATVLAECMTAAGQAASVSKDGGLKNDEPSGVAEDESWDTAFTACSLRFPMDPRYSVPVNGDQIAFLYSYYVTTATPFIQQLGGTVSPPPNLTQFIAGYRTGENWSPFWDVSGDFDRDAMMELPQIPEGFYGKEIADAERAVRDRG